MDIMTGAGLVAGLIVIATMMLLGGSFELFVSEHAAIIIFGGSIAATMIRFPLGVMMHGLPLGARFAFTMSRLSARDLVDGLRSGNPPAPTRGNLCKFKETERILAGFPDPRPDEGQGGNGPATLAGLKIAKDKNMTAPPAGEGK